MEAIIDSKNDNDDMPENEKRMIEAVVNIMKSSQRDRQLIYHFTMGLINNFNNKNK